jgi:hypothetical protein
MNLVLYSLALSWPSNAGSAISSPRTESEHTPVYIQMSFQISSQAVEKLQAAHKPSILRFVGIL